MTSTNRRAFLRVPIVATPALLYPRRAAAFPWLAAAQLAISAVGAFTKSDSGMGAFLGALKELSEENIRLSQEILKQIGEVQRQIANMPTVIAEAFITNNEYVIRERLQTCIDDMKLVTVANPLTNADRTRLESIVRTCQELAAKRYLPYGKRGVASTCAPLAAALDAHARKLLGREDEIPKALNVLYVDWLDQVLDFKSSDSLVGIMTAQGRTFSQIVSEQAAKIRAESSVLADLTTSAVATGVNTFTEGDIECGGIPDFKTRHEFCKGLLYGGDSDGYFNCMGSAESKFARLTAKVTNNQVPVDPATPERLRPNLALDISISSPSTCPSPVLVDQNTDVAAWAAKRRELILANFAESVRPIDISRAALLALYSLYQEANDARRRLKQRVNLGV